MTDWGAHHIGGALFAAQLYDKPLPVEVIPPDGKDYKLSNLQVCQRRADAPGRDLGRRPAGLQRHAGRGPRPPRAAAAPPEINIPSYKGHGGIFGDFLHCVKTRQRPFRDIEIAHRTVATCHLANIVFWLGRPIKFDPGQRSDRRRRGGQPLDQPAQTGAVGALRNRTNPYPNPKQSRISNSNLKSQIQDGQ